MQSAFSHKTITNFDVTNTTTTVLNTPGYYKAKGTVSLFPGSGGTEECDIVINDGATTKSLYKISLDVTTTSTNIYNVVNFDVDFVLQAGDTFEVTSTQNSVSVIGAVRQIASIDGTLTNP